MKVFVAISLLFFALPAFSQELPARPKKVLLDNYFNNERKTVGDQLISHHYTWEDTTMGGYSILGSIFTRHGGDLQTLRQAPTKNNLRRSDLYIIVDPDTEKENPSPNYIQKKHVKSISKWVRHGGVLLLFANDSANTELKHFNQLAERFGIRFTATTRNKVVDGQLELGTLSIPSDHLVFKTARRIYLKDIAVLNASGPARPLLEDTGDVIMAVASYGKGIVFAVGDPWLYNEYIDGTRLPAELENYKAAEDLVQWSLTQGATK